MSIIAILLLIALVGLRAGRAKAQDLQRKNNIMNIRRALEVHAMDKNGAYPVSFNKGDCEILTNDSLTGQLLIQKGYLKTLPNDPSDHKYMYTSNGNIMRLDVALASEPNKFYIADKGKVSVGDYDSKCYNQVGNVVTVNQMFIRMPYYTNVTENSATINWETLYPGTSVVHYGLDTFYGTNVTGNNNTKHTVGISSLVASTEYNYQVETTNNTYQPNPLVSNNAKFQTSDAAAQPPPPPPPACQSDDIPTSIVISEVYYDAIPAKGGNPAGQWIELYNPTDATINLRNWYFKHQAGGLGNPITQIQISLNQDLLLGSKKFILISYSDVVVRWNSEWYYHDQVNLPYNKKLLPFMLNLNPVTDYLLLYDNSSPNKLREQIRWGNWPPNLSSEPILPDTLKQTGNSFERKDLSCDTDTYNDFEKQVKPNPGDKYTYEL